MSLDVYLKYNGVQGNGENVIFIREGGENKVVSYAEFKERYPDRVPIYTSLPDDTHYVYERNITHNLAPMAREAGVYQAMWRPEEIGAVYARDISEILKTGLDILLDDPERFEKFNPQNGWGSYENLVDFVITYFEACEKYPDAEIGANR